MKLLNLPKMLKKFYVIYSEELDHYEANLSGNGDEVSILCSE